MIEAAEAVVVEDPLEETGNANSNGAATVKLPDLVLPFFSFKVEEVIVDATLDWQIKAGLIIGTEYDDLILITGELLGSLGLFGIARAVVGAALRFGDGRISSAGPTAWLSSLTLVFKVGDESGCRSG